MKKTKNISMYEAIRRLGVIEEIAIRVMEEEQSASRRNKSYLSSRATDRLGYDESEYADNTAVIGIMYKDRSKIAVLHMDGKRATSRVADALVVDIKGSKLEANKAKFAKRIATMRKMYPKEEQKVLKEVSFEYEKYIIKILESKGLWEKIPNKENIIAVDLVLLR